MRFAEYIPLLLLISISLPAFSQGCDEEILAKGKELGILGYQPRTPKNRCEGLYYDHSSGISLALVSLTRGKVRYQLRSEEIINIHQLPDQKYGQVWIRGTSFKSRPKYRLDMPMDGKKKVAQLPVKDVLNESRISSTDVGFFGYVSTNTTTVYLPVTTTSKFYSTPESGKIFVTIVSNVETDMVVYKYAESVKGVCQKFSDQIKLETGYGKMEPIEIELPQHVVGKEICFEISVKVAGTADSWSDEQFTLYIPPNK